MRYGGDYDRGFRHSSPRRGGGWTGYRGYGREYRESGRLGPPQDTNWMGRTYRDPREAPRRRYGNGFQRGPREGAWGPERVRGYGYDRGFGAAGWERGYDRGYRGRGTGWEDDLFGPPFADSVAREAYMGRGPTPGTGPNWMDYGGQGGRFWRSAPRGDRWFTGY